MSTLNYNEFKTQSFEDWAEQLERESKTGLTADKLEWEAASGLKLKAYYTEADRDKIQWLEPFMNAQMAMRKAAGWRYMEEISATDATTANADARHALETGAEAISFWWQSYDVPEYPVLFRELILRSTPIWIKPASDKLSAFSELIRKYNPGLHALQGGLLSDPLSELITKGKPFQHNEAEELAKQCKLFAEAPHFYTIQASGLPYADAGADAIQELAFTLSAMVQYCDALIDFGLSVSDVLGKTLVTLSLGTHFFTDIAKLRAMRVLMGKLQNAYNLEPTFFPIHARSSIFTQTLSDPQSNLLRNSTAALAAVTGNADFLTLLPHENGAQTRSAPCRLARNVSNLLREEVYAGKTMDMASGSYFVDSFTVQLAEAAWDLFAKVEAQGGFLAATHNGFIQNSVLATQLKRREAYYKKEEILVGGNKYTLGTPLEPNGNFLIANPHLLEPQRLADC